MNLQPFYGSKTHEMRKLFKPNYKTIIFILLLGIFSNYLFNIFSLKFKPDLVLASVFFFSIFNSTIPSKLGLIIAGIILDTFNTELFGISSVTLLLVSIFIQSNSASLKFQKFNIVWLVFLGVTLAITLIENMFYFSLVEDYVLNINNLLDKMATVLIYPLMHAFFALNLKVFEQDDA